MGATSSHTDLVAQCEACSEGILVDAPIYLRRDRVYCSPGCRDECPRAAKAFSYEAYQGKVLLCGAAAQPAVTSRVNVAGLTRDGPSVSAGLWRMATSPAASQPQMVLPEEEQSSLSEASVTDYMPIEAVRLMFEGVELLGRTALKCAAWPLQSASLDYSLEDSLVRAFDTVGTGPMIKDNLDVA